MKVLPNMIFGRWTVLEVGVCDPNSKSKTKKALCKCECGTIKYKEYRDLYDGRSKSCGCLRRERTIAMNWEKGTLPIGSIYGKLEVIEDLGYKKLPNSDRKIRYYKCRCECGNYIEVSANNLKSKSTQSCGCIKSRGERMIIDLLVENNINFITQYTFPDLKTEKNGILRFDFAIFKDNQLYELIEFQGRQHYFGPDGKWSQCDDLETIQLRDNLKVEYCKKNNIKLIIIPYTDIGNIDLKMLDLLS